MTITTQTLDNGKTIQVKINGRFDFSIQKAFRDSYRNQSLVGTKFIIDLSQTDYIDSSALGMLLLLKEHAEGINGQVLLRKPSPTIAKIIKMANFDQLFNIE